ncbi:MAG: hypothetical protein LBF56_02570 [Holosporales bacterium]|nr:hypothetical protein [Holosporales bacterium]
MTTSWGGVNVKTARYLLCIAGAASICATDSGAAYSGEDPEIRDIKDNIKGIKSSVDSLREADDATDQRIAKIEENVETSAKEAQEAKAGVDEVSKIIEEKIKTSEIPEELQSEISTIKEKIEAVGEETAKLSEGVSQITENVSEVQKDLGKWSEGAATALKADDEQPDGEKVDEDGAQSSPTAIKPSIEVLGKKIAQQQEKSELLEIEGAKATERISKLERQATSSSGMASYPGMPSSQGGGLSGLLGTAASGLLDIGLGFLSDKLGLKKAKEQVLSGQPILESEKDLSPDEIADLRNIENGMKNGQSDQELQERLKNLEKKIAQRAVAESKFQSVTFYGINNAFKDRATILTIFSQAKNGKKVALDGIIKGSGITQTDQELVDTIYDMAQKNATLADIEKYITLVFGGIPSKIVKPNNNSLLGSLTQPLQAQQINNAFGQQLNNVNMAGNMNSSSLPQQQGMNGNNIQQQQGMVSSQNQQQLNNVNMAGNMNNSSLPQQQGMNGNIQQQQNMVSSQNQQQLNNVNMAGNMNSSSLPQQQGMNGNIQQQQQKIAVNGQQQQGQANKHGDLQSVVLVDLENNTFYEINKEHFLSAGTKTTTFPAGQSKDGVKKDGVKVAIKVDSLTNQPHTANGGAGQQAINFQNG